MTLRVISKCFLSQLSQQITLDQWQQGDDIFTDAPQTPKVDLVPCFPDDFWSYLEGFDEYSSEHLDFSMKMIINHRCAQVLIGVRTLFS
jgi:hypothetical protein